MISYRRMPLSHLVVAIGNVPYVLDKTGTYLSVTGERFRTQPWASFGGGVGVYFEVEKRVDSAYVL